MQNANQILKNVRTALESESRVNMRRSTVNIVWLENRDVILNGEMAGIEEKRMAVERAKSVDGVRGVVDRLCVRPTTRRGDGAIRDAVCRQLLQEPVYSRMAVSCRVEGDIAAVSRKPDNPEGTIEVSVGEGVVTLRGRVSSLSHRRLAAVLVWWVPGCRNVVNELEVSPTEQDNDDEIRDAITLVLDKDPTVHSDQITTQSQDGRVVLRGLVATEEEKRMAGRDVWYVDGVSDLINELDVRRTSGAR